MMHFLIDNGADLDIFDNEGWTPLHAAASVGSLPFVEYVVQKRSSIIFCLKTKIVLVCRLLIEKGANPVAVNHDGDTPYDLVKSDGDEGVREFLLQIIEDEGEFRIQYLNYTYTRFSIGSQVSFTIEWQSGKYLRNSIQCHERIEFSSF